MLDVAPHNVTPRPNVLILDPWVQDRHIYIRGVSGTGKTEGMLKNIAYQYLEQGVPFTAIDPLGGMVDDTFLKAIGAMNRRRATMEFTPFAALNASRKRGRLKWLRKILLLDLRTETANGWVLNPWCPVAWMGVEEQMEVFLLSVAQLAGKLEEQRRLLSMIRAVGITLMKLAELDGVGSPTLRDAFDLVVSMGDDIRFLIACLRNATARGGSDSR